MRIRNRSAFFTRRPEGAPPADPRPGITKWVYYLALLAVIGYVGVFLMGKLFVYEAPGQIVVDRSTLSSPVSGTLRRIAVSKGRRFEAGEVLAVIDPHDACSSAQQVRAAEAQGEVRVLEARLDHLRGQLRRREQEWERARAARLMELRFAPGEDPESIRRRRDDLKGEVAETLARLSAAREAAREIRVHTVRGAQCGPRSIVATRAGQVVAIHAQTGEVRMEGDPVLSIEEEDASVRVVAYIESAEAPELGSGAPIRVRLPNGHWSEGRVSETRSSAQGHAQPLWDGYRRMGAEIMIVAEPKTATEAARWRALDRHDVIVKGAK